MNFISGLFFISYVLLVIYFILRFFQNEYNLSATLVQVKKDLKKVFRCCINKKKVEAVVGKEKTEELSSNLEKLDEDCKEPFGLPLDICMDGDFTKEELLIKEKILNILNQKNLVVKDGGKNKKVVPMECLVFLTKNMNPLVTEDGDITVKINRVQDDSVPTEDLRKLVIALKDNDSILYQDDEEILNSMKRIIKGKEISIPSSEFTKEKTVVYEQKEVYKDENLIEVKETTLPKEEFLPKEESIPYKEVIEVKPPVYEKFEENIKQEISMDDVYVPIDDNDELSDDDLNDSLDSTFNINDALEDALNQMDDIPDFEEPIREERDREQFYKDIKYKSIENIFLNFDELKGSLGQILGKEEVINAIIKNLSKTQPLIYNSSKTVVYIDKNNFMFAIAQLFGMNKKEYINNFKKLSSEQLTEFLIQIENYFDLLLSDISGTKKCSYYLVEDENYQKFYIQGFVMPLDNFKKCFNRDDLDFFRSFPYNPNYKFIKMASSEEITGTARLIADITDVEIKN